MNRKAVLVLVSMVLYLAITVTQVFAAAPESSFLKKTPDSKEPAISDTQTVLENDDGMKNKNQEEKKEKKEKTKTPPGLEDKDKPDKGQGPEKSKTPKPIKDDAEKKGKSANFRGVIEGVGADSLDIAQKNGPSVTVLMDENTQVKIPSMGKEGTQEGLREGMEVSVKARLAEEGDYVAETVHVIPGKPERIHHVGVVTEFAYDEEGGSITIEWKDGSLTTYEITAETVFLPASRESDDLVGMRVTVISPRDVTGGPLTAKGIVVHPETEEE